MVAQPPLDIWAKPGFLPYVGGTYTTLLDATRLPKGSLRTGQMSGEIDTG
jgi:hypothetical protein